ILRGGVLGSRVLGRVLGRSLGFGLLLLELREVDWPDSLRGHRSVRKHPRDGRREEHRERDGTDRKPGGLRNELHRERQDAQDQRLREVGNFGRCRGRLLGRSLRLRLFSRLRRGCRCGC
ncbi:MAG: hypothetical protein ACK559_28905, partial [bacterium]